MLANRKRITGDSHEIASDRPARWYAPLWRDDQEAGRDPQKRARHLFPSRRQEAKRRPVDACPLQGLGRPRARTVGRGGGRDQVARTGRRGAALVIVSRMARSSLWRAIVGGQYSISARFRPRPAISPRTR